jgi:hypothetical protein
MAKMVRVKMDGTAKAAVYNAAGVTYGVCAVDEITIFVGTNAVITNRLSLLTAFNLIEKIGEAFMRRRRITTPLPTATDRVLLKAAMTPAGQFQSAGNYTRSVVAAATTVVETEVGIIIGSTVYGTAAGVGAVERTRAWDAALTQALKCYKDNVLKKS